MLFQKGHGYIGGGNKKGSTPWNKGKKGLQVMSEETKIKIGNAHRGFKHSKKSKQQISKSRIERKKRLGYLNSPSTRKRMSKSHIGIPIWNKDKICPQLSKENNGMWRGGKITTTWGYIKIYYPNHPFNRRGYVREHRLVMEKYLGRYLKPKEIVHHINNIKTDNRIKNLMLFKNESAHAGYHYPNGFNFKKI